MTIDLSYLHEPFVKVHRSTALTVGGGSNVTIDFDTSISNTYGCWDFSNHWFKAPKAGRYCFIINFGLISPSAGSRGVFLVGAERLGVAVEVPASYHVPSTGVLVSYLNVDETVQLHFVTFFGSIQLGENTGGSPYTSNFIVYYLP